jgi:hypothetical protein
LQLRIFRKGRVTEEFTLGEVPLLPKNACSQLPKVTLQGFGKIPAALCGDFPAKPPSTPAQFRYCFLQLMGLHKNIDKREGHH